MQKIIALAATIDHSAGCVKCWILVRRALLTQVYWPEPKRREMLVSQLPYIHDAGEAYGYETARARSFHPMARDHDNAEEVLPWVCWLARENNGKRDVKVLAARAFGTPWWKIGQRAGRGERQVKRWHDGAVQAIYYHFLADVRRLDPPGGV